MKQLRQVLIGAFVGLICTFVLGEAAVPVQAASYTVNCSATDFLYIQDAVNFAPPGATVKVCPYFGVFSEQVFIYNKPGLKLIGVNYPMIIPPVDDWGAGVDDDPVMIRVENSDNVTISGFVLDGNWNFYGDPYMVGIGLYNSSGTITKNVITRIREDVLGSAYAGVGIEVASTYALPYKKVSITKNTVSDVQKFGIAVYDNVSPTITSNRIQYSGAGGAWPYGINLGNLPGRTSPIKIPGGTVSKNTITGDWNYNNTNSSDGIEVYASDYVTIKSNKISGNATGIYAWTNGELWSSMSYGNFSSNEITDANNGVVLYAYGEFTPVMVDYNKVQSNKITSLTLTSNGVLVDIEAGSTYYAEIAYTTITKNTFAGFLYYAIYAEGVGNTISPNKFLPPPAGAVPSAPPVPPTAEPHYVGTPAHGGHSERPR